MPLYRITAKFADDAKGRLRMALKLMGAESVRIEDVKGEAAKEPVKPDNRPSSAEALAVAALFGRKPEQEWSDTEIALFKEARRKNLITIESMTIMSIYYKAERAKGRDPYTGGIDRRDLATFLRNVSGENDRALAHSRRNKSVSRRGEWTPTVLPSPLLPVEPATREEIEAEKRRLG